MPPSTRPSSGQHPPVDHGEETRIKVAVLETRLDAIEQTVKETKSELTDQIAQLGADLGGVATKEEVRHLSAEVAGVRSAVDRLIGACKRGAQCAPTEPLPRRRDDREATTKDEGDITVKALFWNSVVTGLKLIGAGIVVGVIVLLINSKQISDHSISTVTQSATHQPSPTPPAPQGGAVSSKVASGP